MGLIVDAPRPTGGNSNAGNTARTAFSDEGKLSDILEIDQELIHRIHVLLIAVNLDCNIDRQKLKKYGNETAELWVKVCKWYQMPVTLHQLFRHAWESLFLSELPISFLTEQSLESSNKFFKQDRRRFARKTSRRDNMEDLFTRQCARSDLLIGSLLQEKIMRKQKEDDDLPEDIKALLAD